MQTRGITPYPVAIGIASCRWLRLCRSRLALTIHLYPFIAVDVMCLPCRGAGTDKGMTMATMIERIEQRAWVAHVDDESDSGSGYMVCLADGYDFESDPGCGVRGFDTLREVERETRRCNVVKRAA